MFAVDASLNQNVRKAAEIIKSGGLVVCPTSGLYGLAADALNAKAVRRVFHVKGRPIDKPLLALISHQSMLSPLVTGVPPMAERLIKRFWPGGLTLVMDARAGLPPGLCSDAGKIGVRLVAHPVAAALVAAVGRPVTGTSANMSGEAGCAAIDDISSAVIDAVDLVIDAGPLDGGPGSTVVDVTGSTPEILRHGALAADDILSAI
jgi:L-threonylcarbamoyladenylate synthase